MRAPKVCSDPMCPHAQPCPVHPKQPWKGSRRQSRTKLSGHKQQKRRAYILRKHLTICHLCGNPGATIADHVIPLAEDGPDTVANMRPAHEDCHRQKTAEEAQRGRERRAY